MLNLWKRENEVSQITLVHKVMKTQRANPEYEEISVHIDNKIYEILSLFGPAHYEK